MIRKNIEALLESGITAHAVSKATGIPRNSVYKLYKGISSIDNITLRNAELMSEFYERTKFTEQPIIIDNKVLDYADISGYMDEDILLPLVNLYDNEQAIVDAYIKQARKNDKIFLDILLTDYEVKV